MAERMLRSPFLKGAAVDSEQGGLARARVELSTLATFAPLTLPGANPIWRSSRSTGSPAAHSCARRLFRLD